MLKFFRRIRRQLIDSGNLKRYFIYAIGEILLVVIGILIAVQINELNVRKAERRLEQEYIARLKSEMVNNLKTANDQITFSALHKQNAEIIFSILANDTLFLNTEPIVVAIEHLGWTYPVQYDADVWLELINNGNIRLLQNDSLRNELIAFHSEMRQTIETNRQYSNMILDYRKLTAEVLSPKIRFYLTDNMHPLWYKGKLENTPNQSELVKKLNELPKLSGLLVDHKIESMDNIMFFQDFKKQINRIIKICDIEFIER